MCNDTKHEKLEVKQTAIGSVINILEMQAHENALKHGFYDDIERMIDHFNELDRTEESKSVWRDFLLAQIAKIMGEGGEAVSAIQHGDYDGMYEELADIVIRVLDLAGYCAIPIGDIILAKMEKNKNRPYKHGKEC